MYQCMYIFTYVCNENDSNDNNRSLLDFLTFFELTAVKFGI